MESANIPLLGMTTVPPDLNAPQGQLSLALNMSAPNGAYEHMRLPEKLFRLSSGDIPLTVHTTAQGSRYLIFKSNAGKVCAYLIPDKADLNPPSVSVDKCLVVSDRDDVTSASVLGNTIVLTGEAGISYSLWKDGSYLDLGARPPQVDIEFGLRQTGTLTQTETYYPCPWQILPSYFQPKDMDEQQKAELENADYDFTPSVELHKLTEAAYGLLLKNIEEHVSDKGYFYQPFFVRYAYRMFDGTYAWHSSPVLLLATTSVPTIYISGSRAIKNKKGYYDVDLSLYVPYFELMHLVHPLSRAEHDRLELWSDVITGIEIFISQPLYTYNQSADLKWNPDINGNAYQAYNGDVFGHFAEQDGSHFAEHTTAAHMQRVKDYFITTGGNTKLNLENMFFLRLERPAEFASRFADVRNFHRIVEMSMDELKSIPINTEAVNSDYLPKPLDLSDTKLQSLVSYPTLPDDYQSNCTLRPEVTNVYNGRLNMAGLEVSMPAINHYHLYSEISTAGEDDMSGEVYIKVHSRRNGVESVACAKFNSGHPYLRMPRYFYYPDPNAYKAEIWSPVFNDSNGTKTRRLVFPLTPHEHLNGAYFFYGLGAWKSDKLSVAGDVDITTDDFTPTSSFSPLRNKVYTSEVQNPFVFPAASISTVSTGSIIAMAAATRAMSQGQFGQYPLYVFTDEGVWALAVSESGSFASAHPVSREVILSPSALVQLDDSILFATEHGLIQLAGAQTQCLSESIANQCTVEVAALPNLNALMCVAAEAMPAISNLLEGAVLTYDYPGQRIIVSNFDKFPYDLVLSLKSMQWSAGELGVCAPINAYPYALALDWQGYIVDLFPRSGSSFTNGLIVTRPFALNSMQELKTVRAAFLRGTMRNSCCRFILYGSRDLMSWHVVRSSSSARMTGFSGSPYRYFRLAIATTLSPNESISHASIFYDNVFRGTVR